MYFDQLKKFNEADIDVEYNVYEVSPDVSIDFVSFTTEESEGCYQPYADISPGPYKHTAVICKSSTIDPAPVYKVAFNNPLSESVDVLNGQNHVSLTSNDPSCQQFYSWSHTISDLRSSRLSTKGSNNSPSSTSSVTLPSKQTTPLQVALNNFKLATSKSRQELALKYPDSLRSLVQSLKGLKKEENVSKLERDDHDSHYKPIVRKFSKRRSLSRARNSEIEYKWKELSKSMVNLKMTKTVSNKIRETDLNKSSEILDYLEKDMDERKKIQQRCKSVFNISSLPDCDHEEVVEIPENNLQELSGYQARIKASTDKLNVPRWYKSSSFRPLSSLASSSISNSSTPSWKSSLMTSSSLTSSSNGSSYSHWRTAKRQDLDINLPKKSDDPSVKFKAVSCYYGWRQNVDKNCQNIVTSPSQRLAKTMI